MDERMMEDPMSQEFELPEVVASEAGTEPFLESFGSAKGPDAAGRVVGLEAVHDVPVKVQAVLGRSRMPIGELLRLKSGMVVELDRRVGEPVDIFVNNRLIARGEVVMIDNSLGVTLTEIVRQEN
jgi:flagellar motor switch protein FliN/FliY